MASLPEPSQPDLEVSGALSLSTVSRAILPGQHQFPQNPYSVLPCEAKRVRGRCARRLQAALFDLKRGFLCLTWRSKELWASALCSYHSIPRGGNAYPPCSFCWSRSSCPSCWEDVSSALPEGNEGWAITPPKALRPMMPSPRLCATIQDSWAGQRQAGHRMADHGSTWWNYPRRWAAKRGY